MTCIVGWAENGKVYIGGDSAGTNSSFNLSIRKQPKVFKVGPFLIGYTSSFRMGQLLEHNLGVTVSFWPPEDPYAFMVKTFIPAVRSCLKDGGWAMKEKEQEEGGFFLVGYKGRLFEVQCDYQVCETILPFNAVGCGAPYALGSLWTNYDEEIDYESTEIMTNLLTALEAAETFSAGVRGPFHIEVLESGN